jgi:large subunit ribosomal protein L21
MFAVIQTGGKQYKVAVGEELNVEKLDLIEGDKVEFDALLVEDNGKVTVGNPMVKDVKVKAEVVEHGKGEKIIIFKYTAKKRTKSKNGHRQPFTKIKINAIG